ncbi:MAG: endonuclease/exonuclease/phosphatase family protein [Planctomycetota bacterium]
MRIASFNVENLFDRARALDRSTWTENGETLERFAELNELMERQRYTAAVKRRLIELVNELGMAGQDRGPLVQIRKIRGQFVRRPRTRPIEIAADGRGDWVGWAELRTGPVDERAMRNTGRVLRDVNADVVAVVEAENRIVLDEFQRFILEQVGGQPYAHTMLIDGNDKRGIDVGLLTREGFSVDLMRTHVFDLKPNGFPIFGRDCPEFAVQTPSGEVVWVLVNHFKSKGYGSTRSNNAKRLAQAEAVAKAYEMIRSEGFEHVVVAGDLNDTPGSAPLAPLVAGTDLRDVDQHPSFDTGEFDGKGTYKLGNDSQKIDYLLLSPALFERVTASGLFRMGAWPGSRPPRWTVYQELVEAIHAASDHHAIWADIDI